MLVSLILVLKVQMLISYFILASCPSPMKNRDFVLQSSWLQTQNEYILINHSVHHHLYPPRKDYVRALSYLTGNFEP